MATTGRSAVASEPDAASVLSDAEFVRVTAAPTGGSVAAAAMLADACDERAVPFQVRVARSAPGSFDDSTASHVTVGIESGDAAASVTDDVANDAFALVREAGGDPDPVLAFAGAVADGVEPSSDVREAAGLDRRPGVGVPTADLAAGLAHSTLFHASFSGDEQAAGATLAELGLPPGLDESARRRLASVVALDATEDASERAADAVAAGLRPHATPDSVFETVEGYADVLAALAWDSPGLGVAFALGAADRTDVVEAWRAHARDAHETVRVAELARHRGVVVVDAADSQPTVARLVRDYRAEEDAVLAVGDGAAALATTDADARAVLPDAVGTSRLAATETDDEDALVETVRGAL
ncbi:hypothetical protein [Halobacterium jilantaiense]|uniref:Replication complex protein RecJ2 n=1 Tax=Halobacterium jilantaiense TaxID=355548 RepID=A0A1I0N6E8_9EURY|nr:hypothetical protein [Halobacterium jilantaiense]SEV96602.1 hypothetical protein SAMN04487945_0635 [Halobacterium jilantaiense]